MTVQRRARKVAFTATLAATATAVAAFSLQASDAVEIPTGPEASNSSGLLRTSGVAGVHPAQNFDNSSAVVDPTATMADYLQASFNDVHATWTRLFSEWGYVPPTANTVFPTTGEKVPGCGAWSDDTTMQYCLTDDTITFSQEAARGMWSGQRVTPMGTLTKSGNGDMSVALLMAHEYGHNIEAELGLWGDDSLSHQAARERGADCFAGVWTADAYHRGVVDDTDYSEAYAALDLAAEHPELDPRLADNGVHGTPAQRQAAFEVGVHQGAKACVDTYLSGTSQQVTQNSYAQDPYAQDPSGSDRVTQLPYDLIP